MRNQESVTTADGKALRALWLAFLGVLTFSFTFPATKLALRSLEPWFISSGRAVLAGLTAGTVLFAQRARLPSRRELRALAIVAGGCVLGFPLLSSLALQTTSSAHGAVVIAVLPAVTAMAGVIRTREAPSPGFWVAAFAGAAVVGGYTLSRAGGRLTAADLYLAVAVVVCALGYAEGGLVARSLGAPQTICWALVLSLPVMVPIAALSAPGRVPAPAAAAGFAYVSFGSMLLGFFAWYAGLARAGVARASQVQLMQTPLTLLWSAIVLGEGMDVWTALVALVVLMTVAATQRARIRSAHRTGDLAHHLAREPLGQRRVAMQHPVIDGAIEEI